MIREIFWTMGDNRVHRALLSRFRRLPTCITYPVGDRGVDAFNADVIAVMKRSIEPSAWHHRNSPAGLAVPYDRGLRATAVRVCDAMQRVIWPRLPWSASQLAMMLPYRMVGTP